MPPSTRQKTSVQEDHIPDVASPETSQLAVITAEERAAARAAAEDMKTANQEALQSFMNWLAQRAETTDEDQYEVMASIAGEIMRAENPAEALAEKSTVRAKEVIGRPFLLHSVEIRQGDYEESMFQHYAVLTISAPGSSTTRILTTGATKVLMKLCKLDQFDEWPQPIMFTSKPGKKGDILDIVSY